MGQRTRDTGQVTRHDTRHGTRDTGLGTRDTGRRTRDAGHGTRDMGYIWLRYTRFVFCAMQISMLCKPQAYIWHIGPQIWHGPCKAIPCAHEQHPDVAECAKQKTKRVKHLCVAVSHFWARCSRKSMFLIHLGVSGRMQVVRSGREHRFGHLDCLE